MGGGGSRSLCFASFVLVELLHLVSLMCQTLNDRLVLLTMTVQGCDVGEGSLQVALEFMDLKPGESASWLANQLAIQLVHLV